jgi:release factor glutamine methyltransferase
MRLDRLAVKPIAYQRGYVDWRGLRFRVNEHVLVPRKETEALLEVALELPAGSHVHEVGTGCGAVALALKAAHPGLYVTASDLSTAAVAVARENAKRLRISVVPVAAKGIPPSILRGEQPDLILANLPYLSEQALESRPPEVRAEPRIATTADCGDDGLGEIRKLISEAPSGWELALEHDTHHGPAVREMLVDAETRLDINGDERVTVGCAP